MIQFVDSVVVPGVLSGELELSAGKIYLRDGDVFGPVKLTVGQLEYYIKIKKLRKLYARFNDTSRNR